MLRVGVIDDSLPLRTRVRDMIADLAGISLVGEAGSLTAARREIPLWAADVIVLDLRLADGNGLELLRELKSQPAAPLVIVFTNYGYDLLRDRCLAAGAEAFLDKGTDLERLSAALRRLCGAPTPRPRHRSRRKRRAA